MVPGMTMSRQAFEAVEETFELHPATLPGLFTNGGAHACFVDEECDGKHARRLRMVIKAAHKYEIGNYMLSLTHDVSTGWTSALLCGHGVLYHRQIDKAYGRQKKQILDAISACPTLWSNPLLLPCILLQNYLQRVDEHSTILYGDLIALGNTLGVTLRGGSGIREERDRWPQDIDPKPTTIRLHSLLPQARFMEHCCNWLRGYASFLLQQEERLRNIENLQQHRMNNAELRDTIQLLSTMVEDCSSGFVIIKDRATWQDNLLFNVISQQDSILNRWDSRLNHLIARSNKQDSISMTTFTFITALFLPGTFIATLFGMSMFDWLPDNGGGSDSTSLSTATDSTPVSNKLWIFWLCAVPLTLITMTCWYMWSKLANQRWIKELRSATSTETKFSTVPDFPYKLSSEGDDTKNPPRFLSRFSMFQKKTEDTATRVTDSGSVIGDNTY